MNAESNRKLMRRRQAQGGFTLVELIAVLVILGILAMAALPKFFGFQERAQTKVLGRAVSELNAQVSMSFSNNSLQNGISGRYEGFTGELGADFIISGQALNTPDTGTIKLVKQAATYTLNWQDGTVERPGYFSLGNKLL